MDKGIEQAFPKGQQAHSTPPIIMGWYKEKALPHLSCEHSITQETEQVKAIRQNYRTQGWLNI